jgi:8-oxo-dGTP pyrophosphatase MutT (NUDIX family)
MSPLADRLRQRLAGPLPGLDVQLRMAPRMIDGVRPRIITDDLRHAAALLLVYPHDGEWRIPLTLRGSTLRHHTSQVSLPGGRIDAGESVEAAALREAHEEIGIEPRDVDVLRVLTPLPIPVSSFLLHPVVGIAPDRPEFRIHEAEVERLIEVPLSALQDPAVIRMEQRRYSLPPYTLMDVPYFHLADDVRVWGATAMVLWEFLALLDHEEHDRS